MVCLSRVGFTFAVIVVLEFYPACWAVCDAHLLCSGEYLFSELFVFSGACSAHCSSSSSFSFVLFVCVFVLGGGASQRQRDERLHRLTLLFACSVCSLFSFRFSSFLLFWDGGCRVVRAQLCEHARDTTVAFVCCVCLMVVWCVFSSCALFVAYHHDSVCCPHHALFVINGNSAQH